MKPFLRWPGGKRAIADRVLEHIPTRFERYVEPFCGAAAVFFALRERQGKPFPTLLADRNTELMHCYRTVRDDLDGMLEELDGVEADEGIYYAARDASVRDPDLMWGPDEAARFYYLNRCCFNGVWRVNRQGRMNVPYGRSPDPVADVGALQEASRLLQDVELMAVDFRKVLALVRQGDVVYVDPPYPGGFVSYTAEGFDDEDQVDLARLCRSVSAKGARVVVSLPDCELVRDIYPGTAWALHELKAPRSVSRDGNGRGSVPELLIVGGP